MRTNAAPKRDFRLAEIFSWKVFVKAGHSWLDDECMRISAAISFYTIFSLAPILVIATAIAGAIFGRDAVQGRIVGQMRGLIGEEGAVLIQDMIRNAYQSDNSGFAAALGIIVLLFGASAVFAELRQVFERIWGSSKKYSNALVSFLLLRLRGLVVVVGIGFLLLVSLVASTVFIAVQDYLEFIYGSFAILADIVKPIVSILFTTGLFMLMMTSLIPERIPIKLLFAGSLLSAVLFELGKFGVGFYVGKAAVASSFGAAGSLAVLLIWFFYVAMIVLFGAEFTAAAYRSGDTYAKQV